MTITGDHNAGKTGKLLLQLLITLGNAFLTGVVGVHTSGFTKNSNSGAPVALQALSNLLRTQSLSVWRGGARPPVPLKTRKVFLVLAHYRRRILHFNVIRHNVFLQDRREPSERNDEGAAMAAGIADFRLQIGDFRLQITSGAYSI